MEETYDDVVAGGDGQEETYDDVMVQGGGIMEELYEELETDLSPSACTSGRGTGRVHRDGDAW